MPYGVDKKIGGDSKENDNWMEKCVGGVTGTNKRTGKSYTKGEKIAICKSQLDKTKKKGASLEDDIIIDESIYNEVSACMGDAVAKLVATKRVNTQEEALLLAESMLAKAEYNIDLLKFIFNR